MDLDNNAQHRAERGFDKLPGESSLIDDCRGGDTSAFKVIHRHYVGRVYALCMRLSGQRWEAEEIAQEVFIQVWKSLVSFKGESEFSTWLYRIASNVAISHLRRTKAASLSSVSINNSDEEPSAHGSKPETLNLDQLIVRLPKQARMVFVLFAIEGYRHEEISQQLGIAVGTSKAQYFRARSLLKEWLEDE